MHVTDWLPTLAEAVGAPLVASGGFDGIDGVSHWKQIVGADNTQTDKPRSEILFNIDGINGTGEAALRVGNFKLLRSANPLPGATMGLDLWCDICNIKAGCNNPNVWPRSAGFGGTFCYNTTTNATAAKLGPSYEPVDCLDDSGNKHGCWLFDLEADPSESNNLATTQPDKLKEMLATLTVHNKGNVGCCSCQLQADQAEMGLPPKDGVWSTFHDMSDPTVSQAPLCDLLRKPPAKKP